LSSSACRMGSTNAAVFPEPVSASPMTSRPARARGMASRWIGVARVKPRFAQASHSSSRTPKSLNVLSGSSAAAGGASVSSSASSASDSEPSAASDPGSDSLSASGLFRFADDSTGVSSSSSLKPPNSESSPLDSGSGCGEGAFAMGFVVDFLCGALCLSCFRLGTADFADLPPSSFRLLKSDILLYELCEELRSSSRYREKC
jgi:hypothetical protein